MTKLSSTTLPVDQLQWSALHSNPYRCPRPRPNRNEHRSCTPNRPKTRSTERSKKQIYRFHFSTKDFPFSFASFVCICVCVCDGMCVAYACEGCVCVWYTVPRACSLGRRHSRVCHFDRTLN